MNMYGINIQSAADELKKVREEQIYHSLRNPKPAIETLVRQLRTIYAINKQSYATLKRQLPYFVCGIFNPPFRRKENFAYTETFLLDIDHLSEKGLSLATLRTELAQDPQVLLCFASPSEDGLKVMFSLKERCYDAGLYSIFYKAFASDFAQRHHLEQVIDARTSDVSRACFLSIDPEAYFNAFAEPIDLAAYVDTANPSDLFDLQRAQAQAEKELQKAEKAEARTTTPRPKDPEGEAMATIRSKLNPNARPQPEARPVTIPQQLNDIIDDLRQHIEATGIIVAKVVNIQYAKKIQARLGLRTAEVNLFYGKRGYSVVISPRVGTDGELNELLAQIIEGFIYTH